MTQRLKCYFHLVLISAVVSLVLVISIFYTKFDLNRKLNLYKDKPDAINNLHPTTWQEGNVTVVRSIPKLMPGGINLPEVLHACALVAKETYGERTINLKTLKMSNCQQGVVCEAISILRKYFKGPAFNIGRAIYHLNILKSRKFAKTKRQSACSGCFEYNFRTLIAPASICGGTNQIDLLIQITTVSKAASARAALRLILSRHTRNNTANVRHMFLIGAGGRESDVIQLSNESAIYGDILQDDYIDTYYNLSYKVLSGFKWASKNCPQAKFIARTGDDVYMNIPRILKFLTKNQSKLQRKQVGLCYHKPYVDHHTYERHYQTWNDWPSASYDSFCVGTTFIFSGSGIRDLVRKSANVPWFNLEDHWVAAVMATAGLSIHNVPGFNTQYYPDIDVQRYRAWRNSVGVCKYDPYWYTLHRLLPTDMIRVYHTCRNREI